jgi:hypothetical protein
VIEYPNEVGGIAAAVAAAAVDGLGDAVGVEQRSAVPEFAGCGILEVQKPLGSPPPPPPRRYTPETQTVQVQTPSRQSHNGMGLLRQWWWWWWWLWLSTSEDRVGLCEREVSREGMVWTDNITDG